MWSATCLFRRLSRAALVFRFSQILNVRQVACVLTLCALVETFIAFRRPALLQCSSPDVSDRHHCFCLLMLNQLSTLQSVSLVRLQNLPLCQNIHSDALSLLYFFRFPFFPDFLFLYPSIVFSLLLPFIPLFFLLIPFFILSFSFQSREFGSGHHLLVSLCLPRVPDKNCEFFRQDNVFQLTLSAWHI